MEIQIEDLLASIKKEGIQKANAERDKIIKNSKDEAETIIKTAKAEALQIIKEAEEEANKIKLLACESIKQASRNVVLSLKGELEQLLKNTIKDKTGSALSEEGVFKLIKTAMEGKNPNDFTIEVSKQLVTSSQKALCDEVSRGLEIRASKNSLKGFKLIKKDGSGYYDFSEDEILELILPYLQENIKKVLGK